MAGITSTKKIKGQPHLLAYITPNEVEKLKALGGQETMTKEGIPAYPEFDNYTESSLAGTSSGEAMWPSGGGCGSCSGCWRDHAWHMHVLMRVDFQMKTLGP